MPLVLEPNSTFRVVLESDKPKPIEQQPYFEFKYLSGREWKKVAKIADSIEGSKDGESAGEGCSSLKRKSQLNSMWKSWTEF